MEERRVKMKQIRFVATLIIFSAIAIPVMAQVTVEVAPPPPPTVRVAIPLPPPIVFAAPPEVVVLPETEVYVVPSVPEEFFFSNGYWWRPWNGRWYRSLYYDRGWAFWAGGVPVWYRGVYPGWRENYRLGVWGGHPWHYHHIAHHDLHDNWRNWHNTGHWNKPEHREFTHHHDGKVYTASHQGKGPVNKAGQAQAGKGVTQANISKSTTATGQGQAHKGVGGQGQGQINKSTTATGQVNKTTTQGTFNKTTATGAGQGHVGAGSHGATGSVKGNAGAGGHSSAGGNVHGSGQMSKGQHNQ